MFKVTGDTIEYDGYIVGTLLNNIPTTVRINVEYALDSNELQMLRDELDNIDVRECNDCKNADLRIEDLEAELETAINQRDAYAAILGVKP